MIFWQHLLERLEAGQKAYVLTVIENSGSSPGRKGFKMLVGSDDFIFGSIGGGVMEFALVEEAKQLLLQANSPNFIKKQIHKGNIKDGSGMICSGEQIVAFHCLDASAISTIENLISCIKDGKKGTLSLSTESFSFADKLLAQQFEAQINSKEDWIFEEHIGFRETLHIVGGGHVGVAVSQLFASLGFHIVVYDNRENLNTLVNNAFAHQKSVIDYHDVHKHIPIDRNAYVVIMTNKYTDDKLVLSKLISKAHKFIGVLGSKAKLKTMWKELIQEGFSRETLEQVHAPIGLAIKSETPEEIAVSIAAQIIQIKNG